MQGSPLDAVRKFYGYPGSSKNVFSAPLDLRVDPAKTFFRLPWIWGWIQQKRFFGSPGFGGGSSKNTFSKFAEKLSASLDLSIPPLSAPLDPGVDPAKTLEKYSENVSGPLFQAPFSCLNILSVPPFQSPSAA